MKLLTTRVAAPALLATTGAASAQDDCAAGKTIQDGALTIATDPPHDRWVVKDAPESGEGSSVIE